MKEISAASLALVALAVAMLVITILPAEVWAAPVNDAVYHGFDHNLIYTTGDVRISSSSADATASEGKESTINLATTLRRTLAASVVVAVYGSNAIQPFRIGIWSPWTGSGFFVVFGPFPNYPIQFSVVANGSYGPTLIGGSAAPVTAGSYQLGITYTVAFVMDRAAGTIRATVSGPGLSGTGSMISSQSPELFGNVQASLTASADAGLGTAHFILTDYVLTLPHERSWAAKIDDTLGRTLMVVLAVLGSVAIVIGLLFHWRRFDGGWWTNWRVHVPMLAVAGALIYFAGNAVLFPLGGHPFDFANEELYAYVSQTYGTGQLFFLPDVTSLASIWNGTPWVHAAFPYNAAIAYLFGAIGWLTNAMFGLGAIALPSSTLGYVIKAVNVGFGLADAALIYAILSRFGVSRRWSRTGAAMFAFNPAVWFSMSVWGQTHVVSIFFVLLAILFAQRRLVTLSWLPLIAASLTRPQMVVFTLLLGLVFLRLFSWRSNLLGLSWSIVLTFVAILPLTLATSPSLPIDVLLNNVRVQEVGGNQPTLTTVSQDAYSIWPLITYVVHGASSVERAFTPSSAILIGSITYQRASQVLTVLTLLAVSAALLLRRRSAFDSGGYLPLVAVGVTAFFMLLTGIVATHFLLALPMLLLCRRWMDGIAYCFVVVIWSITTLVPMYGDMGVAIAGHGYSLLSPDHNIVTQLFVNLYAWDKFITVAIIANLCAVIWLVFLGLRLQDRTETIPTFAA